MGVHHKDGWRDVISRARITKCLLLMRSVLKYFSKQFFCIDFNFYIYWKMIYLRVHIAIYDLKNSTF